MKAARVLAFVFVAACTADARCDPTLHVSRSPAFDAAVGGERSGAPPCAPGGCEALRVSSGAFHSCAVIRHPDATEATYCWGRNRYGELGPEAPRGEAVFAPRRTSILVEGVGAGSVLSCVTGPQGSQTAVQCMGENLRGVMGEDADVALGSRQILLRSGFGSDVSAGALHVVARIGDSARLFGDATFGQLGAPVPGGYTVEGIIAAPAVREVDAGGTATCLLTPDGAVACAGVFALDPGAFADAPAWDPAGVLDLSDRFVPIEGIPAAASISVGASHACALDIDGVVWCWGSDVAGESGGLAEPDVPVAIALPDRAFVVSAGGAFDVAIETPLVVSLVPPGATGAHTCALVGRPVASSVWCWGRNDRGQLGDGTLEPRAAPSQVPLPFATDLSAGGLHTCAVADGEIWCWGDNTHGQLGVSPDEVQRSDFPIRVDLGWAADE